MSEHDFDGYFTSKQQNEYNKELLKYSTPLINIAPIHNVNITVM